MRTAAMKEFVEAAATSGPLGSIVTAAVEDGNVVASTLEAKLKEAGYSVEYKAGNQGHWVWVRKPDETGNPVDHAHGYSNTTTDALKQAMFAAVRQEVADKAAPQQ